MHASGESASTIANTLGVSRATVYRVLAEQLDALQADQLNDESNLVTYC